MIRILHVVSSLNINAGTMSVIMNYYRHIDRSQIQFDFLYFEEMERNHSEEILALGGRTFIIEYALYTHAFQKSLKNFFDSHKDEYVAVHCHPIWGSILVGTTAKRAGITHIIQHSHSTQYSDKLISAIRNKILLHFMDYFATDYMACSPEAAMLFDKPKSEVTILNNAIDLKLYLYNESSRLEFRREFKIEEDTFVVGNVGRLCPQKNQLFLLDIFSAIKKIEPNSKLIIVGSGNLKNTIEKKIGDLKLNDSVIMTGRRTDVDTLLSSFDICVMPSLFEGAPVAVIEALAAGLPCVISDTITKSIKTNNTYYCSLNIAAKEWADKIFFIYNYKINNRHLLDDFLINNFDITKESTKLVDYYRQMDSSKGV